MTGLTMTGQHLRIIFWITGFWTLLLTEVQSQYTAHYNVVEGIGPNTEIGDVVTDSGLGSQYPYDVLIQFRYDITTGDYKDDFSVDAAGGRLRASTVVDREALCPRKEVCSISLDVAVVQPIEYFQVIKVTINVLDLNDNIPTFPHQVFNLQISENTNPGVKFVLPAAHDPDRGENSIQQYRLESNTSAFALKVNDERGGLVDLELILVEPVDRETQSSYTMHVVAIDGGNPPKSGFMQVIIKIVDANDNSPVFLTPFVNVTVPEDLQVTTTLVSVHAEDIDTGVNGQISYSFVDYPNCSFQGGNENVLKKPENCQFCINTDTGAVVLRNTLDYETSTTHLLLVTATDHGPNAVQAYAKIIVNVVDVNDAPPIITVNSVGSGNTGIIEESSTGNLDNAPVGITNYAVVEVLENLAPHSFVAYVTAEDTDLGDGGIVTCYIDDDINFNIEKIFDYEYEISTRRTMDRETQASYNLRITCRDHGDLGLSSEYLLLVRIGDMNDNSPVFTQSMYMAELRENNAINVSILRVLAEDADAGKNAEVTYHVHATYRSLFTIDEYTGILRPKVAFDREKTEEVEAEILCRDRGNPPRTAATHVRIKILDENDNPPIFSKKVYSFGTFENQPHGTEIGTLTAYDKDTPQFAQFTYSLRGVNNSGNIPFVIDRYDGTITTTRMLDRERNTSFAMVATVTDSGNSSLKSTANVTVYVADKNDHPPVITFPNAAKDTVVIKKMPKPGTVVTVINASDKDLGENAKLHFGILHGNDWALWDIDENTGEVIFAGNGGSIPSAEHVLVIVVTDGGYPKLTSTAHLKIIFNMSNIELDPMHNIQVPLHPDAGQLDVDLGGIGPALQFKIILILAIVTTFIVLILVAIIVALRRRQLREKRAKNKKPPPPANNQDHTYLFVNNNESGSGFVKGVCDPRDVEKVRCQAHVGEHVDGTSILDLDLSSSGISMGSEGQTDRYPMLHPGQYHLSPPGVGEKLEADWLHDCTKQQDGCQKHNAKTEAAGPSKDQTPLTIRNIAVNNYTKDSGQPRVSPTVDINLCSSGPPRPPVRNSTPTKCSNEFLQVRPGSITKPASPIANAREPPRAFRTFHPDSNESPWKMPAKSPSSDTVPSRAKYKTANGKVTISKGSDHNHSSKARAYIDNSKLNNIDEVVIHEVTI